jgi:hypothetical protein
VVIKLAETLPGNSGQAAWSPEVAVKEMSATGITTVSMDTIMPFDKVLVGNEAILYG